MGTHRSDQPAHGYGAATGGHPGHSGRRTALWVAVAVLVVVLTASIVVALVAIRSSEETPGAAAPSCARTLRVVTSSSFAPVLAELEAGLDRDGDCVALDTVVVDGREAAGRVAEREADVWIPDDASWAAAARQGLLAEEGTAGSGTVLATSPIYMVADRSTATRIERAGGSWEELAEMLTGPSGLRLAVRDPNGSGDGMVAAGSIGEAVWLEYGMDASAMALATALRVTRTVRGAGPALPERSGEVGLVPEYALLPVLDRLGDAAVLSGSDHTALLRFGWLPTAAAAGTPEKAAALGRLLSALKGPSAATAISAARLRRPDGAVPPDAPRDRLPKLTAKPFEVLKPHHVDHVFASWNVQDRKGSILLVVDVSGSMQEPAAGTRAPRIDLVRQGCLTVAKLLPDEAALGLWSFGSHLDGARDYRTLLKIAPLTSAQRGVVSRAVGRLRSEKTGTGLYDTILAAYRSATASYLPGMPNQVVVFTDGRNEDDPDSITAAQLKARLAATADPKRPVVLTVVAYGVDPDAELLAAVVDPVHGYVSQVRTPEEVSAAFMHAAASGLHG